MIISRKYKYIFIGIPYSASSTISRELLDNYDGETFLHKHANFPILARMYRHEFVKYTKIAVIRDPIQIAFSVYNKYLTNAYSVYTEPKYFIENGGHVTKKARNIYRNISERKFSFEEYIKYLYKIPYDSLFSLNYKHLDFVIHYDRINEDFKRCLNKINIDVIDELPIRNVTKKIDSKHKLPDKTKKFVFGPFYKHYSALLKTDIETNISAKFLFNFAQPFRFRRWNQMDTKKINNQVKEYDDYYYDS